MPLAHSRTLFLGDDGVPLRFYIRPGPTKASLLPLIIHGGGVVCRIQEPGAILLAESGERPLPSGFTSAQLVLDSVERNQQLALEGYAAERDCGPAPAGPLPQGPAAASASGRSAYTRLEDVAILIYVSRYGGPGGEGQGSVSGNALWREMERVQVTGRSWQSMKERYLRCLRGREHLYQIDSRSVIPTVIFPSGATHHPPQEAAGQQTAKPAAGKRDPANLQHVGLESNEDAPAPVEQVPDVNSEEECFNIFSIAIREFQVEEEPPEQLVETSDEMETENVPQTQQMETDKAPQVCPGERCPKQKGTLAEFIMDSKQSELDSQTPVDELSSQGEVDYAIRDINTLMQTHDLDLCAATQLLLKNNGELAAALHFLETGHRPDGYPIWTRQDDLALENVDGKVQERLIRKFGSENVAKRIAFQKS